MIFLITGASHTGKTKLAQSLLEEYGIPYLSMDLLKMGLIRSGQTDLSVTEDAAMEAYLWPVVREMIRTAMENGQMLIVEGGYIPAGWEQDFSSEERRQIRFVCLIMTKTYIEGHFDAIRQYANAAEKRLDDSGCTREWLIEENRRYEEAWKKERWPAVIVDQAYDVKREAAACLQIKGEKSWKI